MVEHTPKHADDEKRYVEDYLLERLRPITETNLDTGKTSLKLFDPKSPEQWLLLRDDFVPKKCSSDEFDILLEKVGKRLAQERKYDPEQA